jgi:TrmH family RNA methyltransferase
MTLITSRQNPKIKQIRGLAHKKQRVQQGLFVVEGIRHIGEAVEAGAHIEYLFYAPDQLTSDFAYNLVTQLELTNVPVFQTTPEILAGLAEKDHPQGILAVVRQNLTPLERLNPENFSWGVAITSPQDPGNLGTILRTLDSAGADGLIVIEPAVDVFHPTAVRASMGTLFWKPVVYTSLETFTAWQAEHSYHIYGTSAKGSVGYTQEEYQRPAVLFLGSERQGLTVEQSALCTSMLRLPMLGRATSLNLSVAAGVLLYHMQAQLLFPENNADIIVDPASGAKI